MDVNQTYCGYYFAMYTNTESLRFIPEADLSIVSQLGSGEAL